MTTCHVALFQESLDAGVRVTVSAVGPWILLCGVQLHQGPERLRVFDFQIVTPLGEVRPIEQFAGTFHGLYFRDLVKCSVTVSENDKLRVSFAPMAPDDTYAQSAPLAAALRFARSGSSFDGKISVEYDSLLRIDGRYGAIKRVP